MSDALTIGRCPASGASRGPVFGAFQRHAQRLHELVDLDWLGEISEESSLQPLLDVARHGIGAESDNRRVRRRRLAAQNLQRFESGNIGQIDIHKNYFRLKAASKLDAELAVHGGQEPHIGPARDELFDKFQVGRVVLDIEQRVKRRTAVDLSWSRWDGSRFRFLEVRRSG